MTILCRRILASKCCLEREDFEIGYVIGYKDLVLSVVYDMTQMANTSLEMIAETYFLLQQNLPNYCIFQLMVFNKHIIGLYFGMLHLNDIFFIQGIRVLSVRNKLAFSCWRFCSGYCTKKKYSVSLIWIECNLDETFIHSCESLFKRSSFD